MIPKNQNLFLVGPMGAGKTSIGKQLARRLRRPFVDSDRELERRTGVDIPTIFEYEGEEGFRQREIAVIEDLSRRQGIVLATGGGAVTRPQNRQNLSSHGIVIYLRASVDTQLERTAHDKQRPLLQTDDPQQRLERLFAERDPLYRAIADLTVDTDEAHIPTLVNGLIRDLETL